jgi:hypothetical protein
VHERDARGLAHPREHEQPAAPLRKVRAAVRFAASFLIAGTGCSGQDSVGARIDLPGGCFLRLLEESDAADLYALVDGNRTYLARWLSWVEETRGADDVLNFIRATRRQIAENKGFGVAIVEGDSIIGVIGFHSIDWTHGSTASATGSPKVIRVAGR